MSQITLSLDNLGIKLREHNLITETQLFNAVARQKVKGSYLSLSHDDLKTLANFLLEKIKNVNREDILQKIQEKTYAANSQAPQKQHPT